MRDALRNFTFVLVIASFPLLGSSAENPWPQFLGPEGNGHATAQDLPIQWSESENIAWKVTVPGKGWSSPVISSAHVWLTTAIEKSLSKEEQDRLLKEKAINPSQNHLAGGVELKALCFRRDTGEVVRDIELRRIQDPPPIHSFNSYASPTPILDGERIYCHFGTMGTFCLDTQSGKVLWRNLDIRVEHLTGPGASPVLWRDSLIFPGDGADVQFVIALDKHTGRVKWKTDRSGQLSSSVEMRRSFCTPTILEEGGRSQLISPGATWVYSYDPGDGRELWRCRYPLTGYSVVPRPVAHAGKVFIFTGFGKAELFAVRYDGQGDVTDSHVAWNHRRQCPTRSSPILVGDELYFVADSGIATCLDASSGKIHWMERLGGNYSASPLHADGRIYFFSQEGKITAIEPATEFRQLATSQLDEGFMATPAAVDHEFYLRTRTRLFRIEKKRVAGR